VSIKGANLASDYEYNQHHESLALTGVDHLRRPKNAMGVLRGCGCFTMSELSSTVGGWVGCGNFGANAEGGISGPHCAGRALEPMLSPSTPSKPTAAPTTFAPGVSPVESLPKLSLISLAVETIPIL
jgi:hypothetical protein